MQDYIQSILFTILHNIKTLCLQHFRRKKESNLDRKSSLPVQKSSIHREEMALHLTFSGLSLCKNLAPITGKYPLFFRCSKEYCASSSCEKTGTNGYSFGLLM